MMLSKVSSQLQGECWGPASGESVINNEMTRSNPLYEENMKTDNRNSLQPSESGSSGYSSGAAGNPGRERSDFCISGVN